MNGRPRLNTQLMDGAQWSRDLQWIVTLKCDNRGNVFHLNVTAQYGREGQYTYGHFHKMVSPFDDLSTIIQGGMVDAACLISDQLVLFNEP
jgi:hypothetical protein